jgi:hypothetical protein
MPCACPSHLTFSFLSFWSSSSSSSSPPSPPPHPLLFFILSTLVRCPIPLTWRIHYLHKKSRGTPKFYTDFITPPLLLQPLLHERLIVFIVFLVTFQVPKKDFVLFTRNQMAVETLKPSDTKLVAVWIFAWWWVVVVNENLLEVFNNGLL